MVKKKANKINKSRKSSTYPVEVELAMQKALGMHKSNMLQQAETIYKNVLISYPKHSQANHLYGLVLFNKKNYSQAIVHIKNAIKSEPKNAEFINNLGIVYKDAGKLTKAKKMFRLSIKKNPGYYSAFNGLGSTLMLNHEYKEASSCFKKALGFNPGYSDAIYNLALSYLALKNYRKAEEQLLVLKKQSPDNSDTNRSLYTCYMGSNNYEAAADLISTELKETPEDSLLIYKLAEIYEKQSRLNEADKLMRRACNLDVHNAKYVYLQAVINRRLGKIKDASDDLKKIKLPTGDNVMDQNIYFELGRVLDKSGDYDAAFKNYNLANKAQSESLDTSLINKERFISHIDNVSSNLTNEWVSNWKSCDAISENNVVFMVAFPRSGTTLLDQILDGHSKIQVMEEVPILGTIISQIVAKGQEYPACIEKLSCKDIKKYRNYYFKETQKYITLAHGNTLVDKLPLNIVEIQLIKRLFPSSKIILSLRHPYDVCLSNFMQHFSLNDAMANFLTLEDAARTYRKVMDLWRKYTSVLQLSYHAVRYEDLVDDTEEQARALIGFLGFEWEPDMLNHVQHAKTRNINTPSYQQVTQPIYNSSRYRWKNYEPYFDCIPDNLQDLIEFFGYSS